VYGSNQVELAWTGPHRCRSFHGNGASDCQRAEGCAI
jgi:hypothetical protein